MKKIISQLVCLLAVIPLFSCTDSAGPSKTGFNIKLALSVLEPTSATIVATPSDSETEYRFYVVPKTDYKSSVIPEDAETAIGQYRLTSTGLNPEVDYYAVAALQSGYSSILEFNTSSAVGSLDPEGHPADFNIISIPMKQSRSAKRGVYGSMGASLDPALLGKGVSWDTDGTHDSPASAQSLIAGGVTFYPTVSSAEFSESALIDIKKNFPSADWVFGYNEPNNSSSGSLTPSAAAASWPSLRTFTKGLGMSLSSPSLIDGTASGKDDPVEWLDEFIACKGVGSDAFDALALHCYKPSAEQMREMFRRFDKYGKPLFVTEFCHFTLTITNDAQKQLAFMSDALNLLESDSAVAGYSWYMTRAEGNWAAISLLNDDPKKPALTPLGKLYVNFSSFDKNCHYVPGEPIPAAHYVANNLSGTTTGWSEVFKVRPCTDAFGSLMVVCDTPDAWMEYQVEVNSDGTYALAARYSGDGAKMALSIDGGEAQTVEFPASSQWGCKWVEGLKLSKGRHTLRLGLQSGSVSLNWLYMD